MYAVSTQHTWTVWALLITLAVLAVVVTSGIVIGKRRVKRTLPGKDTDVES